MSNSINKKTKYSIFACAAGVILLLAVIVFVIYKGRHTEGYRLVESRFTLESGLTFTNIQVGGMRDRELQDKINRNLNRYFAILERPWFNEENIGETSYIVHCQTERYLSVEYLFENHWNVTIANEFLHLCITVDMETGDVVFLDDLVRLDEEFADFLKRGNVLNSKEIVVLSYTAEEASKFVNDTLREYDSQVILRTYFQDFTKEYLYGDWYRERGYNMADFNSGLYSYYFYIEEGAVYFRYAETHDNMLWMYTDDIEDYLLVPKW